MTTQRRRIDRVHFCRRLLHGAWQWVLWVEFKDRPPRTEELFGAVDVKRDVLATLMERLGVEYLTGFEGRAVDVRLEDGTVTAIRNGASDAWLTEDEIREA